MTGDTFASLALGFPELEFSRSEVHGWPKEGVALKAAEAVQPSNVGYYHGGRMILLLHFELSFLETSCFPQGGRYIDPSRNHVFLNKSCQARKHLSKGFDSMMTVSCPFLLMLRLSDRFPLVRWLLSTPGETWDSPLLARSLLSWR